MFTYIIFFLAISSISVLAASFNRCDYEECVPCSIFGIIFILYIAGLLNSLRIGVYFILGVTMLIFLISQAGIYRDDFWFLKSLVRPLVIDNHNYYISPNGVLDMTGIEDITKVTNAQTQPTKMSAEQWKNVLKDNYDFVLLYNIDESFRENYHSVFLDPTTIFPDSLYQVQEDGSLLYIHFAAECV